LTGKKLLELHASFHILSCPLRGNAQKDKEGKPSKYFSLEGAQYQTPEPFFHEDYKNIENVTAARIEGYIGAARLLPLTKEVGLPEVIRWKPAEVYQIALGSREVVD
jgi:hypothetical protein